MQVPLPPLPRNSTIGVIYPSSRPPEEKVARGVAILQEWGYRVREFKPSIAAAEYLAAPDQERGEALARALADESVDMLWAARGGYGVARLLPTLRVPPERAPVPVMGFSDVSLLLAHLWGRAGWPAVHGPNITTLAQLDPDSVQAVLQLLNRGTFMPVSGMRTVVSGRGEGPLLPMNLTMLLSVVGTPYEVELAGAILALEDVGEADYRVDRALVQLTQMPAAAGLAGLVVGDLAGHQERPLIRSLLSTFAQQHGIPFCTGAPLGHGQANRPLPVGAPALLKAGEGALEVL